MVTDHQTDSSSLLEVGDRCGHRAVRGVRRPKKVLERLPDPESDAALRVVVELHLPQRDIVASENLPAITRIVGVLVDADLHWCDLRPPARLGILCLMYLFLYERCTMNGVLVF